MGTQVRIASAAPSTAGAIPSASGRTGIVIASVNGGQEKARQCEAAHTISPADGANEQTEQSCCFSHEGVRYDPPSASRQL